MKKDLMKAGLALAAAVVVMTGCGNNTTETTAATAAGETTVAEEETTAFESKSAEELVDEASIVLGEYMGLSRTVEKEEITDEYVEEELAYLATLYPVEVTGRAAKLGDVANIDYTGYDGDVAFEGGTAAGYDLELGSGSFIDGFEDGIVGMNIGDEKDLNLKFPDEYHSEDLAGKEVVFKVKLNKLSSAEDSKVDDDLAKRVLEDESATLDTLREEVRADLEQQADYDFYVNAGAELLQQIVENSEITADPDAVEQMHYEMKSTYEYQAAMYGLELEDFLSYFLGMTSEDLETYADFIVKQEMVLEAIIEKEGIAATDEQKDRIAKLNGYEDAATLLEVIDEETADRAFNIGAANFFLLENSVVAE